ncbi:hypothetical protein AX17_005807 [Amanita inopinata Kibby_2008]|nr:hypothetical protein AX17_005807 [Amanita inopinata Kibby_2008]
MPVLRPSTRPRRANPEADDGAQELNKDASVPSSPCAQKLPSKRALPKPLPACEIIEISSDEEDDKPIDDRAALISDLHQQIDRLKQENAKYRLDIEKYKRQSDAKTSGRFQDGGDSKLRYMYNEDVVAMSAA